MSSLSKKQIKRAIDSNTRGKYTTELNSRAIESEIVFRHILQKAGCWGFKQNRRVGPFYADFIHYALRVIIEVDGSSHLSPKQILLDQKKDSFYLSKGYRVIRVKYPFEGEHAYSVCIDLADELKTKYPPKKRPMTKRQRAAREKQIRKNKLDRERLYS